MIGAGAILRGLGGNRGPVAAALPGAPIPVDQGADGLRLDLAGHHDGRVFGTIVAIEELAAVVVLLGHILHILEEAHRGVAVGMVLKSRGADDLVELAERIGAVLVIFAEHGQALGLEDLGRVLEMLEAVGFQHEDVFEVLFGDHRVVVGEIVAGAGVGGGAGLGQGLQVFRLRNLLGAAEHHVFEQVGEAGLTGLHFIARAGLHDDMDGDDVRVVGGDGHQAQAIREIFQGVGIGQDSRRRESRGQQEEE